MSEEKELELEIGKHLMLPENYGELKDANGIGIGIDHSTKTYVVMYIKRDDNTLLDIMFATNGSQDTTALGSLFTEMVKGDEIVNILEGVSTLESDLRANYASLPAPKIDTLKPQGEQVERISTENQDSANMVLTAFRAAMRHYERKLEGIEEKQFEMSISKTCPYSTTECHFVQKADSL